MKKFGVVSFHQKSYKTKNPSMLSLLFGFNYPKTNLTRNERKKRESIKNMIRYLEESYNMKKMEQTLFSI